MTRSKLKEVVEKGVVRIGPRSFSPPPLRWGILTPSVHLDSSPLRFTFTHAGKRAKVEGRLPARLRLVMSSLSLLTSRQAIPAWNISPIKKSLDIGKVKVQSCPLRVREVAERSPHLCVQGHQFVDIPLAEEDSSDEEYRPDEEDEDETAEDVRPRSDGREASARRRR